METNNIINIPEGFEIDKKKSNKRQIVLKKREDTRAKSWEELCEKIRGNSGWCIDEDWNIVHGKLAGTLIVGEFKNKKDAEAFAALGKLISLRMDWIGMWEPDWTNVLQDKYVIEVCSDKLSYGEYGIVSAPMSFPTEEMCDEFFNTFRDLLEIAKPLL